jgi:reverse transcriptase-like protein
MKPEQFKRWFNRSFWRVFKDQTFPIRIPETPKERAALIDNVYAAISSARYAPSIPEAEIVMNKGHGVARTVPVFCVEDYCVYYFCIKELENVLCVNRTPNTFGGWTLGGRLRQQENADVECELTEYGRYSFNPRAWTHAFGEFNSLLFAQLDQGHYPHVLEFDLSNFYDCVRLDTLERWIREEADSEKGWIITLLFYLLNQWNRRNTGLHPQSVGLPQDVLADCSRILANYYLQRYDQFAGAVCANHAGLYFRYADDQMILLNDSTTVERLLLLITRRLDRFGLRVNQKKVHLWTAAELQEHRCRAIQAIFAEKGDNQNPALVRQFVDAYLAIPKADLEKTWNQGMPLLNRLLWSNVGSLPRALFNTIVARFTSEPYLLRADHKKLVRVHELNGQRARPIDLATYLRRIGERSVHNSYHYEVLAFANSVKDTDLRHFCDARLASLDRLMNSM